MRKTKCPLCKRRKLTELDFEYIENTGRCKKCDLRIHTEDFRREHYHKLNDKDSMDISKHTHIYN